MKRLALALIFAGSLAGSGCIRCRYEALGQSMLPVECAPASAPARAKVYLFLVNGSDLTECDGIQELQQNVICGGYPMVYHAQRFDRAWFRRELHRLHREDADNRFLLIGYGSSADELLKLACRVTDEGIPLDLVGFVDPVGLNVNLMEKAPFRTIAYRSHHWVLSPRLVPNETVAVHNVGHRSILPHPLTSQALIALMTESALRVPVPRPPVPCLLPKEEGVPIPRPDEPKRLEIPQTGDYGFLCPQFGRPLCATPAP